MELKDVIHLYLGCEVQYEYDTRSEIAAKKKELRCGQLVGIWDNDVFIQMKWGTTRTQNTRCTLILRPLSDITEEEKLECVEVVYEHSVKWSEKESRMHQFEQLIKPKNDNFFHKKLFIHLLKQGFDLFGLIESNQAINSTSLTIPH